MFFGPECPCPHPHFQNAFFILIHVTIVVSLAYRVRGFLIKCVPGTSSPWPSITKAITIININYTFITSSQVKMDLHIEPRMDLPGDKMTHIEIIVY